jgi:protein subunit release factor A
VTDHRINLTLYNLQAIINGDLTGSHRQAADGRKCRAAEGKWNAVKILKS